MVKTLGHLPSFIGHEILQSMAKFLIIVMSVALMLSGRTVAAQSPATAGSPECSQILRDRRKSNKCSCLSQVSQQKSHLEAALPVKSVKLTYEKETQTVKPSDETLRLGMEMEARCKAYISDCTISTERYWRELTDLESKQQKIQKEIVETLTETHPTSDSVNVKPNP